MGGEYFQLMLLTMEMVLMLLLVVLSALYPAVSAAGACSTDGSGYANCRTDGGECD